MFKKLLTAVLISSMLMLPVYSVGASSSQGTSSYLPGDVPAQTDAAESMSPALHALVLAMLNHDVNRFDFEDTSLTWEALYNMLSLYGQLDSRSVIEKGELLLPEETVLDYAAALASGLTTASGTLGTPPAAIRDRLNYNNASSSYVVVCGEDNLAQIQVDNCTSSTGVLTLTGALVYQVNGQALAKFQATLAPKDNMFGYAVTGIRVTG